MRDHEVLRKLRSSDEERFYRPSYIHTLPLQDTWTQPFLYWSNGSSYVIISTAADGAADAPYPTWTTAQWLALLNMTPATQTDLRKDIVFAQGQFIQWPAGIQT